MAPLRSDLLARGVVSDIKSLDAASLAALRPVLDAAQREVSADLAAWMKRLGPNAMQLQYTPAHLRQLQVLLGVARGAAGVQQTKGYAVSARKSVLNVMQQMQAPRRAAKTVIQQLEQLAAQFSDTPPPQLIHVAILARGDRMVVNRYPAAAQRYAGQVGDDIRFQLGVGLARGETIHQLSNRIANLSTFKAAITPSTPPGAAGQAMGAGLATRHRHWAERLVRTETINAYNHTVHAGILAAYKMDPRIQMRWDASNDLRVCKVCRDLHGMVVSPTAAFVGNLQYPPRHPNCRCAVVAWATGWEDETPIVDIEAAIKDERTRVALQQTKGPVGVTKPLPVEAPPNFNASGKKVYAGIPVRSKIRSSALYRVSVDALRERLVALPGGGADPNRIASVRQGMTGGKLPPLKLLLLPNGKILVEDGRHRLMTAVELGDRDVLVRFGKGIKGSDLGTVPLF